MIVRGLPRAVRAGFACIVLMLLAGGCATTGGSFFSQGSSGEREAAPAKPRENWLARTFWSGRRERDVAPVVFTPNSVGFAVREPKVPAKDPNALVKDPGVPSNWPIMEDGREIISPFGPRGRNRMHNGMDIRGPYGTPVYATADGIVTFSGAQRGYGEIVMIKHDNGYETRYAHLHGRDVEVGEKVRRGDVIGTLGQTGNATTPHVHYEVRNAGRPVNPLEYFD